MRAAVLAFDEPDVGGRDGWIRDAACAAVTEEGRRLYAPELWDAVPGFYRGDPYRTARRVCLGCSVREECLQDALTYGDVHTMRAGYEPHALERMALERGHRGMKSRTRRAS